MSIPSGMTYLQFAFGVFDIGILLGLGFYFVKGLLGYLKAFFSWLKRRK